MVSLDVVDVSSYAKKYALESNILGLRQVADSRVDVNESGLLMHGSEKDPLSILKYGLVPQKTEDNLIDNEWQVCLGLNSSGSETIDRSMARKNSAVKYAGYFSPHGVVYVLSDDVKLADGYREFWDEGEDGRGYAWVSRPVSTKMITALITRNLALASAAVMSSGVDLRVYLPDGTCYQVEQL